MIRVVALIRVKEGRLTEFLDIFKANVPNVLAEKGCLEYVPTIDADAGLPTQQIDPDGVTIIEKWESLADLQAHAAAPHMLAYREKVKDLVEAVTVKVLTEA